MMLGLPVLVVAVVLAVAVPPARTVAVVRQLQRFCVDSQTVSGILPMLRLGLLHLLVHQP